MDQVQVSNRLPAMACIATLALSGCFDNEDSNSRSSSSFVNVPGGVSASAANRQNNRPSISGNPSRIAVVGANWSFIPSASDQDGDSLSFSIQNKPNWANFNPTTGNLSGRPQPGQEGSYDDISITVSDGEELATLTAFAVTVQSGNPNNRAPTISGSPSPSATIDQLYSFTPRARDSDNDPLTFAVANLPTWAAFDETTGTLSGTPQPGDAAFYNNIVISVSDGELMDSLAVFAINVAQVGSNAVTLTLIAPTENEDGTPLTDLAAFKIYYGVAEGNYPNQISIDNPGVTDYVVENLSPDTYYFVSTAISSNGAESDFSNVVTRMVN